MLAFAASFLRDADAPSPFGSWMLEARLCGGMPNTTYDCFARVNVYTNQYKDGSTISSRHHFTHTHTRIYRTNLPEYIFLEEQKTD